MLAPKLKPAHVVTDPATLQAIETWRAARGAIDPSEKERAAAVTRAEERERKARKEAADLLGAGVWTLPDGGQIAVELGTRGGGDPDHAAAWGLLYGELAAVSPDWAARMVEILSDCKTPGSPSVKLTIIDPPAPPPARRVR